MCIGTCLSFSSYSITFLYYCRILSILFSLSVLSIFIFCCSQHTLLCADTIADCSLVFCRLVSVSPREPDVQASNKILMNQNQTIQQSSSSTMRPPPPLWWWWCLNWLSGRLLHRRSVVHVLSSLDLPFYSLHKKTEMNEREAGCYDPGFKL